MDLDYGWEMQAFVAALILGLIFWLLERRERRRRQGK
jgi:hypothetical protein